MAMKLFPNGQITHETRSIDDARESSLIKGNATLKHLDVGRKNVGEFTVCEVVLNEGVPSECVPYGNFIEHVVGE